MTQVKRKWELLTDENRKKVISEIISFYKRERDEDIGVIGAGEILDFLLEMISKDIYNKGVEDTLEFMKERMTSMELDINGLLKK